VSEEFHQRWSRLSCLPQSWPTFFSFPLSSCSYQNLPNQIPQFRVYLGLITPNSQNPLIGLPSFSLSLPKWFAPKASLSLIALLVDLSVMPTIMYASFRFFFQGTSMKYGFPIVREIFILQVYQAAFQRGYRTLNSRPFNPSRVTGGFASNGAC